PLSGTVFQPVQCTDRGCEHSPTRSGGRPETLMDKTIKSSPLPFPYRLGLFSHFGTPSLSLFLFPSPIIQGPIPSSYLFLLFQQYLPPGSDPKRVSIVDYLFTNPEQICWVLNGYDEFHRKLTRQKKEQRELLDPEKPLPVADLISALLNRQLLPGCTVVVTCRARDVIDLEGLSDKVGQLLGWDCHEIKEYVHNFFVKGENIGSLGVQAADLLLITRHFLAMSSLPALCNICCICLEHLLGGRDTGEKVREKEEKKSTGGGRRGSEDGTNGRTQLLATQAQIPSTLTQVYLIVIGAFLSRDPDKRGSNDMPKTPPQRTVFTDSLYLYVCGLASPHCTPDQLARTSGGTGGQNWVQKRQALVLKLLKKPLCHCVQESQDHQLAEQVVHTRPNLELRNIRLLPNDIDALAFVVNSVGDSGIGLDFGACSMELECLDDLPRCQYVHYLCFRSRKYGDKFAEKLSSILPKFTTLRKLEFCGASLTAPGAASLASALQNCPDVTTELSDNLKDAGIEHIADILLIFCIFTILLYYHTVDYLIGKLSSCLNIDGMKEITVTFSQNFDLNSLLNQKWSTPEMQILAESLARCPALSVLDLSGGQWDVETLRTLTQFLPKFSVTKKIIVNDSCSSVEGLVILTALLSECPTVMELHIRLQSPIQVSIVFSGGREKPADKRSKLLCLSCCGLQPADLEKVWRSLGISSDLSLLDLSSNCLGNKGLGKLLEVLPRLSIIQEINARNNEISMEGVVILAGALCAHNNLTQIHISDGGREQLTLKFCPDKRINNSSLLPNNMTTLCRRLVQCRSHLELDLSHSSLTDTAIENLLKVLLKMTSLRRLKYAVCSVVATVSSSHYNKYVTAISIYVFVKYCFEFFFRPQTEAFLHFESVKAEHASCRSVIIIFSFGCSLSSNRLADEGVKHFLDSLPNLKITNYVILSNNDLTQHRLLEVASTLCTRGNVSGAEVSLAAEERCLIWFTQCDGCENTLSSLERGHLVRLAEIVSACPSLTKLEFKNNLLQSDSIEDYVKLLNSSERGISVSFEERWIRSEEAVCLVCRCLKLNGNIHHQVRYANQHVGQLLVDCAVEGHQLTSMTSIIQKCPLLTELDISHNSLGIEGAEFLCSVLPLLPNLKSLGIGSKEPSLTVVQKLSEALLQATAIQCLNLSGHVIDDTAAQIMTTMLPRLRLLNLSHCAWSAAGGLQLIKALGECVSLEGLCLDSLQLNEKSMMCLAQALKNIISICSLKLNKISTAPGQSGANGLLDLLTTMEGLTRMEERVRIEQLTRVLPVWTELRKVREESIFSCISRELKHVFVWSSSMATNSLGDLTAARMALVLPSLTRISVLDSEVAHCKHLNTAQPSRCVGETVAVTENMKDPVQSLSFLESNSVSGVGAEALVRALKSCPALQLIR
uniref:NACHT domain-containing protein n=1 Tax=Dicentrarchus labrax TaxID=13489 RepID=A0A8P4KCM9_DICLA